MAFINLRTSSIALRAGPAALVVALGGTGLWGAATLVDSSTANTLAVAFPGFPTGTSETSPRHGVRVDLS